MLCVKLLVRSTEVTPLVLGAVQTYGAMLTSHTASPFAVLYAGKTFTY